MSEQKDALSTIAELEEKQLSIYSLILTTGSVTAGDLSLLSGTTLEETEQILTQLEQQQLIVTLPGIVPRYQSVPPFDGLAKEVKSIGKKIENLRKELMGQVKTAAKTVRDGLVTVTDETLGEIEQHTTKIEQLKTEATEGLEKAIDEGSSKNAEFIQEFEREIQTTYDEWRAGIVGHIDPVTTEVKNKYATVAGKLAASVKSWASTAINNSETLQNDLIAKIDEFEQRASSTIDSQTATAKDAIDLQTQKIDSTIHDTKEALQNQLVTLGNETLSTTKTLSSSIEASLDETSTKLQQEIDQTSIRFRDSLSTLADGLTGIVNQFRTGEETRITELETTFNDSIETFSQRQKSAHEEFQTASQSEIRKIQSASETTFESIESQLDGLIAESGKELSSAVNTMHTLSGEAMQSYYGSVQEASQELSQQITTSLTSAKESFKNSIDATGSSLKGLNQSSLGTSTTFLEETRTSLSTQLDELTEKTKSEIYELGVTLTQELEKLGQDLQERITATISSATTQVRTLSEAAQADVTNTVSSELSKIQLEISNQLSEFRAKHEELSTRIESTITQQQTSHDTTVDNLLQDVSSSTESLVEGLEEKRGLKVEEIGAALGEISTSTTNTISQLKAENAEIITEFRESFSHSIDTLQSHTKTAGEVFSTSCANATNRIRELAMSEISGARTSVQEATESMINDISTNVESGKQQVIRSAEDAITGFSQDFDEAKSLSSTQIADIGDRGKTFFTQSSESMSQTLDTSISEINTASEEMKGGITTALGSVKSEVAGRTGELKTQIEGKIGQFSTELNSLTESKVTEVDQVLDTSKTELQQAADQLKSTVETVANDFRGRTIEMATSSKQEMDSQLAYLKTKIGSRIENTWNDLETLTSSFKSTVTTTAEKVSESEMVGVAEETLAEAFPSAADIEDQASGIADILTSAWARIESTDFPGARKTWNISTRAAVLSHIKDMINRAKSKVTLILPYVAEVPSELLVELKSTIGMELVVTEGPELAERCSPLVGRGNIRVRTRKERDVYACVRDGEEVLLAPLTTRDEDVIGVATEDDGFVKFIMSIIGPIFQARTKMLKPEDL
ncbi:MAG: hypothetical protein GF411_04650 [Candidatus Lokiarchaeota archaeon]|nr:hypothetical protein [Candidatus Lokiarchaeota archaeon]